MNILEEYGITLFNNAVWGRPSTWDKNPESIKEKCADKSYPSRSEMVLLRKACCVVHPWLASGNLDFGRVPAIP